jgi:hypothetical protein
VWPFSFKAFTLNIREAAGSACLAAAQLQFQLASTGHGWRIGKKTTGYAANVSDKAPEPYQNHCTSIHCFTVIAHAYTQCTFRTSFTCTQPQWQPACTRPSFFGNTFFTQDMTTSEYNTLKHTSIHQNNATVPSQRDSRLRQAPTSLGSFKKPPNPASATVHHAPPLSLLLSNYYSALLQDPHNRLSQQLLHSQHSTMPL